MECIDLSFVSLEKLCRQFARDIQKEYQPDMVIYVAVGGYLIGKAMSDEFGVPLAAIGTKRVGDQAKDFVGPVLRLLPRWLCNWLRNQELKRAVHKENKERHLEFLTPVENIRAMQHKKLLVVDDSVDTGYSMMAVKDVIMKTFSDSECRIAVLNEMTIFDTTIHADYKVYVDKMLRTPMSKDSREYEMFCEMYKVDLN